MREVWKDIAISNGAYQISSLGRVKSVGRKALNSARSVSERILKTRINKQGYECTSLQIDGKRKIIKIHREVAKAFLDNPCGYLEVNHKDENKTNNFVDNLEWCDRAYNANYGTAIKRSVKNRYKNHFLEIDQYTTDGLFVKRWKCPAAIEKASQKTMKATNIIACCRGRFQTSYGYIWRYVNPPVTPGG